MPTASFRLNFTSPGARAFSIAQFARVSATGGMDAVGDRELKLARQAGSLTCLQPHHSRLEPLFIRVDEVDECANIVAMVESGLLFPHLQAIQRGLIAFLWIIKHRRGVRRLDRFTGLHVHENPIGDLPVADGVANHFDELFVAQSRRPQPRLIKSLAEIRLVIRVELPGEMQSNFIDVTWQVHPATHGFARAAREDDVVHFPEASGGNGLQATPKSKIAFVFGAASSSEA